MTEPALMLIPESFGAAELQSRISSIEFLRDRKNESAVKLCRKSVALETIDIMLVRTAARGVNQLTWRWRATGEKCLSIAGVIDDVDEQVAERILQLDAERAALNYELSVYGSELTRLRRANSLCKFHVSMAAVR